VAARIHEKEGRRWLWREQEGRKREGGRRRDQLRAAASGESSSSPIPFTGGGSSLRQWLQRPRAGGSDGNLWDFPFFCFFIRLTVADRQPHLKMLHLQMWFCLPTSENVFQLPQKRIL